MFVYYVPAADAHVKEFVTLGLCVVAARFAEGRWKDDVWGGGLARRLIGFTGRRRRPFG